MDGWQAAIIIAKAVTYGASLAAPGGALFLLLFGDRLTQDEQTAIRRVAVIGLVIGAVVSIARIPLTTGMLADGFSGMANETLIGIVLRAGEGSALVLRLVGFGIVAAGLLINRLRFAGTVTGIAFVCVSYAMVGHSEAATPRLVAQGLLILHLLCLTYWIGALYPLRRLTASPDTSRVAAVVVGFSAIALYVVGILIIAGAFLLWILLGTPSAILTSEYGRLVLVKLALVALLLGLAALNKLRLTPQLQNGNAGAAAGLRRSITLEMILVALILLVTATFTSIVGPPTLD